MTKYLPSIAGKVFFALLLFAFVASNYAGPTNEVNLELRLIWGTNDSTSPDPKHKPISPELAKKMGAFKWKNYFEVNRQQIALAPKAGQSAVMSPQCTVSVTNLGNGKIDVSLIGQGKAVHKETHPLGHGLLVIGGDATNDTAWFVIVKEIK
jgi:hypothetical protein